MQFILAVRRDRPLSTAIWFLIGLIKPQLMVLPGMFLLVTRRWRALFVCILGSVILFLASSPTLGWNTWPEYLRQLKTVSNFFGIYGIDPRDMYNFRGTLALILGKEYATLINTLSTLALLGSIVLTYWLWRGAWQPAYPGFTLRMALTLILGSFFSLHANPQDGLILIAPAALFYDYLYRRGLPRRLYASFLLLCPILFLISEFTIKNMLGVHIPVLAMMILMAWMAYALYKESKYGNS